MEYTRLGSTGLKVSEICFGTATFGWHTDDAESARMLDLFVDKGGNFVDTADVYSAWAEGSWAGRSEEMIGAWLKKTGKRHDIVLATKCRSKVGELPNDQGLSRRHIMDAVEASLRRLNTDYIDLYQTHHMDFETPIEETMRALDDLVHQGKVHYLGCSNYNAWRLCQALWASDRHSLARYECAQPYYSLLERDHFERELADLVEAEGIAVIPYSPTAGGLLSGKYAAGRRPEQGRHLSNEMYQRRYREPWMFEAAERLAALAAERGVHPVSLAVAWVGHHPAVTAPIVGARNLEQLEPALSSVDIGMTPGLYAELSALTPTPPPAHDRSDEVETPEADTAGTLKDSARRPHRFR